MGSGPEIKPFSLKSYSKKRYALIGMPIFAVIFVLTIPDKLITRLSYWKKKK